jgi:8-oxo-dGTP pyrophosphatase MutT (NUDIX family)
MKEFLEVALVVLINSKGEVLAVSRKDNHEDMGLIGGKCDKGESPIDAAIRETKEEVGLDITNLRCIFQQFRNGRMGYTYLADYSGEIHTEEPHVVKWTSFETVNNGSFGEWNKIVTQTLIDMGVNIRRYE